MLVDGDRLQRLVGVEATTGIGVGKRDERGDGLLAIADDVSVTPLEDGDDLVVDDEDAVVRARDEALDNHAPRSGPALGDREGGPDFGLVADIDRHPMTMGVVDGLVDDGIADDRGGLYRLL